MEFKELSINLISQEVDKALQFHSWTKGTQRKLLQIKDILSSIHLQPSERTLIILDLNGILIDRIYEKNKKVTEDGSTRIGNFLVWLRPGITTFIDFLFEYFDVAVWSSVKQFNVDQLIPHIFGNRKEQLKFVWSQNQCEEVEHPNPNSKKPLFLKNLSEVWDEFPEYNEKNTIIIDDTEQKLVNNPLNTCIIPSKEYVWDRRMVDDMELFNGGFFKEMLKRRLM